MTENIFAKEPTMYHDSDYTVSHNERAELLNGRLAMLGFVAAVGAPLAPGLRIFSPLPLAIRSRLAWMLA